MSTAIDLAGLAGACSRNASRPVRRASLPIGPRSCRDMQMTDPALLVRSRPRRRDAEATRQAIEAAGALFGRGGDLADIEIANFYNMA